MKNKGGKMSIIKFMIVVISFLLGVYLTLERKNCTAIFILVLTLGAMFVFDLYEKILLIK